MRRSRSDGLTLVEVLIAIVILTVGIFALAQLQAASLRATATAEAINSTTRFVRGELERQRQSAVAPVFGETCSADLPEGITSCVVDVEKCYLRFEEAGGSDLVCGYGESIHPTAYRISVSATGPMDQQLTLDALWTGKFIAGEAGGVIGVGP